MAAMGLTGADFAGALKSRKKFVEANDEGADAVEGTGTGDAPASAWGGVTSFTDKSPTGCCGLSNHAFARHLWRHVRIPSTTYRQSERMESARCSVRSTCRTAYSSARALVCRPGTRSARLRGLPRP